MRQEDIDKLVAEVSDPEFKRRSLVVDSGYTVITDGGPQTVRAIESHKEKSVAFMSTLRYYRTYYNGTPQDGERVFIYENGELILIQVREGGYLDAVYKKEG